MIILNKSSAAVPSRRVATDDQINQLPCHIRTQTAIVDSNGLREDDSSDSSGADPPPFAVSASYRMR